MSRGTTTIIVGDCLSVMERLPAGVFHACVTSPPYFALRSYLPAGHESKCLEIGSEPTPDAFLATMVDVFRGVRRVLRDDGYLMVNLGDSYDAGTATKRNPSKTEGYGKHGYWSNEIIDQRVTGGMVAGNQLLMPHRVALALQADGWVLRDTIVWAKKSPMPQSVNGSRWVRCKDCPGCAKCEPNGGYVLRRGQGRTCTAHEYVFMFTKSNRYHYDMENAREAAAQPQLKRNDRFGGVNGHEVRHGLVAMSEGHEQRIMRSVWTLASEPSKYRHFATFPSELVRRMLVPLSPKGCCSQCGCQWAPVVESERVATRPGENTKVGEGGELEVGNRDPQRHVVKTKVVGYRPTCTCDANEPVPCRVLDPFSGTGTTGQTACYLGHDYTGIELNPEYAAHSEQWIAKTPRWKLRQEKAKPKKRRPVLVNQGELF